MRYSVAAVLTAATGGRNSYRDGDNDLYWSAKIDPGVSCTDPAPAGPCCAIKN